MKLLLALLFYIFILGWAWPGSLASKNNEGNKLYKNDKVDEALSKWRDAQIENPDNDKLHYNIGNGLHKQKKYEDAFKEYEKSLNSKDNELQRNSYYNMGNTHYRMGKFLEAIEDYKKCLDINPNDEDAKYNIEFVRKKIKENLKKEGEKQQESQQKEGKPSEEEQKSSAGDGFKPSPTEKEEKESQGKEEKETGEEEKKEKPAGEDKKKAEKESAEEKPSGEEKKDEMSREDAVRLLDALKDDEKDIQKELRNQPIEGQYRVDKDW